MPISENRMPKVSILIPVYNCAEYLREALDSALAQTYPNTEIIAVDDGSTDESPAILAQYTGIKVITKENGGLSAARNDAMAQAEGEYVYFMDSDDWIEKDTVEKCVERCESENLDFAVFDAVSFGGEAICDYHRSAPYPGVYDGTELMTRMLEDGLYRCSACMSFFRRAFLEKIGLRFYPGILHEDELFSCIAYINAHRVGTVDRAFYHRRMRPCSIVTSGFSYRHVEGYETVMRELSGHVNDSKSAGRAIRMLDSYIILSLMHNAWKLNLKIRLHIAANTLFRHPYALRFKPLCILLFKKYLK